ncbi:hypothetical protein B0H12DRAFT_1232793 [Mycena haematopus]|nr:hypothetical protein B0H12DRAFT_1232793 [Mycena haematopus]
MASSSCTTETTTYVLEKYSRAYTSKKPSGSSEWQHFTNPVLRLILDSKLFPENTADSSLRMRIVWTMDGNQDVVLEDLDLLAFSSLKDSSTGKDRSDNSPLKGVYRDTTFGLRYLHVPESTDSQKVYRRFQVSFTTLSLALQLVNAIRDVCPCKTNDAANANDRKTATIRPAAASRVAVQRQDTIVPPSPVLVSHNASPLINPQIQLQRMPTVEFPDTPAIIPRSVNQDDARPAAVSLLLSAQAEPYPPSSPVAPGPSPYQAMYDHPMPNAPQAASILTGPDQRGFLKPPPSSLSTFPDSSPPSSTADSTMMPPPPPFQAPNGASADSLSLTAALRDATGLYDLSHAALERLVGDVVREDGFVRLLENISSMWAMKALVES